MPEEASSWYTALIYSIVSVLMSGFLLLPVMVLVFVFEDLIPLALQDFLLLGSWITIWLGTRFTAGFVQRRYVISDKQDVANLSLVYFLLPVVVMLFLVLFWAGFFPVDIIFYVFVMVFVFYLGSRTHLEEKPKGEITDEDYEGISDWF